MKSLNARECKVNGVRVLLKAFSVRTLHKSLTLSCVEGFKAIVIIYEAVIERFCLSCNVV